MQWATQQCVDAKGVAKAKLAWKERNAVPVTAKAAKDMRPTGRGGFGTAQQQQGGRGAPPPGAFIPTFARIAVPQCGHRHCCCFDEEDASNLRKTTCFPAYVRVEVSKPTALACGGIPVNGGCKLNFSPVPRWIPMAHRTSPMHKPGWRRDRTHYCRARRSWGRSGAAAAGQRQGDRAGAAAARRRREQQLRARVGAHCLAAAHRHAREEVRHALLAAYGSETVYY